MEGDPNLRSLHSNIRSFVMFKNTTERIVSIYWVNYSSKFIHYTNLEPSKTCFVNTYETHPWVFKDSVSGERLHVKNRLVYFPEPWYTSIDPSGKLSRILVEINFPLRSLKSNCIWKILSLLENKKHFIELELPQTLLDDLRNHYCLIYMNKRK